MAGDTGRTIRSPRERATDAFDVELRKYGKAAKRAKALAAELKVHGEAAEALRARVEFLANDPLLDPEHVREALADAGIETTPGTVDEALASTPRAGDPDPLPGS